MALPQRIVFSPEKICTDWQQRERPGAGLLNLGNTCYINVILQCLTYTPPLASYLLSYEHSRSCQQQGFCMMCTMEAHVRKVLCSPASAILPGAVLRDLKFTCLSCQAVVDSYKAFLDVSLDIRGASSLTTVLEDCVTPKELHQKESFRCTKCEKKAAASKRVTVHRAPRVLTLCLERADQRTGTKISKFVEYPEYLDLRPYMSDTVGEPLLCSLYAIVVHTGDTCLEGHFLCYTKASNGLWYKMDDEFVDSCDIHTVLGQQAYLLFYARCSDLKMREMAASSAAPSHAHPMPSQGGASRQQAGSSAAQGLPGRVKVMHSQRNHARERARSRSPHWGNDLCSWMVNSTNYGNLTGRRRRKRTSPLGHDRAPRDATAPGPSNRICQQAPVPSLAWAQTLPVQSELDKSSWQDYHLWSQVVEITNSYQPVRRCEHPRDAHQTNTA